jgi:hypothetical protein
MHGFLVGVAPLVVFFLLFLIFFSAFFSGESPDSHPNHPQDAPGHVAQPKPLLPPHPR